MTTVFIKGFGLIGSSLARAISIQHPEDQIIASDINEQELTFALDNHLATTVVHNFSNVEQADVIILAGPVSVIIEDIKTLLTKNLKSDVIVTDVGSTKKNVMQAAQLLIKKGVTFIGGHPMAGSHLTGAVSGKADLFRNAYYFLITNNCPAATTKLEDLLSGLGVHWLSVDADEHDKIVAQISHVPHVIAAALINQTANDLGDQMKLAAGGLKSVTRIAASDPTMWTAIMKGNQQLIKEQLENYIRYLQNIDELIKNGKEKQLFEFFSQAQKNRQKLDQD